MKAEARRFLKLMSWEPFCFYDVMEVFNLESREDAIRLVYKWRRNKAVIRCQRKKSDKFSRWKFSPEFVSFFFKGDFGVQ